MFSSQMTQRRIDRNYARTQQAQESAFDGMSPQEAAELIGAELISKRMAQASNEQMRLAALSIVFSFAAILTEDDFDDEDLLPSEVLDTLMLEAFDDDDDEDDSDIDDGVKTTLSAHVADALSTFGVSDDVIEDMFDTDVEIADAASLGAAESVLEGMPDDGEDFENFVATFVYSDYEDDLDESGFDGLDGHDELGEPQFDAAKKTKLRAGKKTVKKVNGKTLVYKAVKAIRNGKKVTINKRISGNIRLNAKQKAALRKAQRKSGMSSAIRKQMKSLGRGIKMNLYKGRGGNLKGLQQASLKRHSKSLGI